MKRCPQCQTQLTEVQIGTVQVEGCNDCGGVWFDNNELGAIANSDSTELLALEDQFLPGVRAARRTSQRKCPACVIPMFEFEFPHSPGVRLDGCPQCKGVWADDGELHALYMRMAGAESAIVPSGVDIRRSGRQALGMLVSRLCPHCRQVNASAAQICTACRMRLPQVRAALCPNCSVDLNHSTFRSLSLDVCPDCTGVWLDAGELSALAEYTPDELHQAQNDAAVKRQGVSALWNANPNLLCPKCCVSLAAPDLVYGADVPLDSCLHCNGVWVGAGNLASLSRDYRQTLGRRRPL